MNARFRQTDKGTAQGRSLLYRARFYNRPCRISSHILCSGLCPALGTAKTFLTYWSNLGSHAAGHQIQQNPQKRVLVFDGAPCRIYLGLLPSPLRGACGSTKRSRRLVDLLRRFSSIEATHTKRPAQGRSLLYMARPAGLARTSCARGYALPLALPKRS